MFEWSEEQLMIRDAIRRFIESEVQPNIDALEHGDLPPYDIMRKLYATFGMDQLARDRFKRQLEKKSGGSARPASGSDASAAAEDSARGATGDGGAAALALIPIIELCHYCPGIVTAMGVSVGLAAGTVMKRGTPAQMERWGLDLLTLDKIGAWAITEPDSGSDALGGMKSSARRDGDEYILNGNKTFITNGPFADTIVFYAKLDDGSDTPIRDRQVLTFVLDKGTDGLEQSKPFRKMGLHSSPTGELFLSDVRVNKDRLLGETEDEADGGGRESAKANFVQERAGLAAMSLGSDRRVPEAVGGVRQGPQALGHPDRRSAAHPAEAGQDGGGPTQRAEPRLPPHRDVSGREEPLAGRGVGHEAVLGPVRLGGGHGGRAALRGQRVHVRVPGGAAGSRRQGVPDLCRDRRDPESPTSPGTSDR